MVLHLLPLVAVAGGALLLSHPLGGTVLGVVLVLFGLELRPRFPKRAHARGTLTREQAPHLFGLLDELRDHVGGPQINEVQIESSVNAWCGYYGLRRKPLLGIGLPLWAALSPAGRVALLGHELAHLVNGDPQRSIVVAPAMETFARLAWAFSPDRFAGRFVTHTDRASIAQQLVGLLVYLPIYQTLVALHLALRQLALRDSRRAEYFADGLSAQLAGSDGLTECLTASLSSNDVGFEIRRLARVEHSTDPAAWRAAAKTATGRITDRRRSEQVSIRLESDLMATHPPSGRRLRLAASWPWVDGPVVGSERQMAAIDAELAPQYLAVSRELRNR